MRIAFDGIKKNPHPEEAAKRAVSKDAQPDPADSNFSRSLLVGHTARTAWILGQCPGMTM
jgi:hypothetical protein